MTMHRFAKISLTKAGRPLRQMACLTTLLAAIGFSGASFAKPENHLQDHGSATTLHKAGPGISYIKQWSGLDQVLILSQKDLSGLSQEFFGSPDKALARLRQELAIYPSFPSQHVTMDDTIDLLGALDLDKYTAFPIYDKNTASAVACIVTISTTPTSLRTWLSKLSGLPEDAITHLPFSEGELRNYALAHELVHCRQPSHIPALEAGNATLHQLHLRLETHADHGGLYIQQTNTTVFKDPEFANHQQQLRSLASLTYLATSHATSTGIAPGFHAPPPHLSTLLSQQDKIDLSKRLHAINRARIAVYARVAHDNGQNSRTYPPRQTWNKIKSYMYRIAHRQNNDKLRESLHYWNKIYKNNQLTQAHISQIFLSPDTGDMARAALGYRWYTDKSGVPTKQAKALAKALSYACRSSIFPANSHEMRLISQANDAIELLAPDLVKETPQTASPQRTANLLSWRP